MNSIPDTPKIAVVTGANRGLGLETCRQLARLGLTVVLTSRDPHKGETAAASLRDAGLDVRYHPLDVTDPQSIRRLANHVEAEFGRLDVLVNNAGVFLDPLDAPDADAASVFRADLETVRRSMDTNVYGPLLLCQALVPLMQGRGRIVNLSSGMGQLSDMNGCCPGYRFSKVALNALTRMLADELQATRIKVNSVCPGWVRTDMGGPNANRPVEEGADTIVWLATLPDDGPSGGFFRDRQAIPW
ncbi:MAG: SDR family oxidoreductase [Gammaproteobacteria bacterium]|nr:SDR family oxidoreductase [Gammaproteobacteria bacterium]